MRELQLEEIDHWSPEENIEKPEEYIRSIALPIEQGSVLVYFIEEGEDFRIRDIHETDSEQKRREQFQEIGDDLNNRSSFLNNPHNKVSDGKDTAT